MQKGFWDKLDFPIIGLSPMDGVTDAPMRFVAKKYGEPDIVYTEFVSAEGLWRIHKRGETDHKIWRDLKYSEIERPAIAQIFGSDPESFYEAAKIVCDLGFDGVDINMGCPSPGLEKRGGGAGLIRDKCNAGEVIEATRRGVKDWLNKKKELMDELPNIPVSVKTRIGSAEPDKAWWKFLAEQRLPAVAMHGRTFKQLYRGEADWDLLLQAGEIIRESGAKFLGNGDIKEAKTKKSQNEELIEWIPGQARNDKITVEDANTSFGVMLKSGRELDLTGKMDGVLIGREALGNPWVMRKEMYIPTIKEKMSVMVEHAYKYQEILGNDYGNQNFQFFPMRKHLASYVRGFDGSASLRNDLMSAENAEQVDMIVRSFA